MSSEQASTAVCDRATCYVSTT